MSSRSFGPFLFTLDPNTDPGQPACVAVALALNGVELWQQPLTQERPDATLTIDATGCSASGTLTAVFASPTSGQLQGDQLAFAAPGFELTFTGTVGLW